MNWTPIRQRRRRYGTIPSCDESRCGSPGAGWHAKAIGADYCSLSVPVLSPDQRRPVEVLVSVREKSGRVVEKETAAEDVKFCDLGVSPVTVSRKR